MIRQDPSPADPVPATPHGHSAAAPWIGPNGEGGSLPPHPDGLLDAATLSRLLEPDAPGRGAEAGAPPIGAFQDGRALSVPVDSDTSDADQTVDGLISGHRWSFGTISFSFPGSAADYDGLDYLGNPYYAPDNGFTEVTSFAPLGPQLASAARAALDLYSGFGALNFVEIGDDPGEDAENATLRFGLSDARGPAWAYLPYAGSNNPITGDVWFNSGTYDSPAIGNYAFATVLHELGHALGLKHGHETGGAGAVPYEQDSMEFTVMTYRAWVGKPLSYGYANETWGFAQTPMMLDIAAIQRMYGADFGFNGGDTTYTFSTGTGEMFLNGVGTGTPGGNRIFRTIWDGNGTDTYDFSNYTTNLIVDLAPGGFTDLDAGGNFQRAKLDFGYQGNPVTHARGHVFNAMQFEGDARSLIENALGGAGDDTFFGNAAANTFRGQGGNDRFHDSAGSDTYFGGEGTDTLVMDGARGSYSFTGDTTLLGIVSATVTDWIDSAVEFVEFNDATASFTELLGLVPAATPEFEVNGTPGPVTGFTAQDAGQATVTPDGGSITLTENAWKSVAANITVTEHTVLRFDFASQVEGEIHAIGLETDGALSAAYLFQIDGLQKFGHQIAAGQYATGSGLRSYEIPVGTFFTGDFDRLVLVMDDDAGRGADSTFANVALVDVIPPPVTDFLVDGVAGAVSSFSTQDNGSAEVSPDQTAITLENNAWKAIAGDFTITEDTRLGFTFSSDLEGEVHAIGFETDASPTASRIFQLDGSQRYGLQDFAGQYVTGSGGQGFDIPVGRYFTGQFDRLVLIMDDDAGRGADSTFSDLTLSEVTPPPSAQFLVDGVAGDVSGFGRQDKGTAQLSDGGATIALTGNAWKDVATGLTVTADTVLRFDFASTTEGEIHAIGFETDDRITASRFFQLDGSQTFGIQDFNGAYTTGTGMQRYAIDVGAHFTGTFDRLVFVMDDDAGLGGDSLFSNVSLDTAPLNAGVL